MSARETLDCFSAALLCDERVFSAQEKELLARLLQQVASQPGNQNDAANARIVRAVGEIALERASAVLGESIAQHLRRQAVDSAGEASGNRSLWEELGSFPRDPEPGPRPPGPNPPGEDEPMAPRPPGPNPPGIEGGVSRYVAASTPPVTGPRPPGPNPPGQDPTGPRPPGPNPPSISGDWQGQSSRTAVLHAPELLPGECVVLEEFLAPAELQALTRYALEREMEFNISEVVSPGAPGGAVEFEHRRSRVLMNLGPHREVILNRLHACLPQVLKKLGRDPFPIGRVEAQITASNDGDYFRWHTDNGQDEVAGREITFVYFFHREPKPFHGGELRLYDSQLRNGAYVPTATYRTVEPKQNQMVLFVSSLAHEITPVESPQGRFADSRFTVNGWLHR